MTGGEGFLVMPASQLDQGGLLGDVSNRQVIVRIGATRIDLDGPAQGGFGRPAHAFLAQRQAEEVLNLGVLGIELRRAVERVNGLVILLLTELQAAQDEVAVSRSE